MSVEIKHDMKRSNWAAIWAGRRHNLCIGMITDPSSLVKGLAHQTNSLYLLTLKKMVAGVNGSTDLKGIPPISIICMAH